MAKEVARGAANHIASYLLPLYPYVKEYLPDFAKWKVDNYRYVEVSEYALHKPNGLFSDLLVWLSEHMDLSADLHYRCEAYRNEVVGSVRMLLAEGQPIEITVVQASLPLPLSFLLVGNSKQPTATSGSGEASVGPVSQRNKVIIIKVWTGLRLEIFRLRSAG
jgi:hypothetical protein